MRRSGFHPGGFAVLPVCLALILGGGWCACCTAAAAPIKPSPGGPRPTCQSSVVATTCCLSEPSDTERSDPPATPCGFFDLHDCLACLFASSRNVVNLKSDTDPRPQFHSQPAGVATVDFAPSPGASARWSAARHRDAPSRGDRTLLGLRCALNL